MGANIINNFVHVTTVMPEECCQTPNPAHHAVLCLQSAVKTGYHELANIEMECAYKNFICTLHFNVCITKAY